MRGEALDTSSDGGRTARQVFHHLADSELIGAVRLRKLLSEHTPTIQVHDQESLSQLGCYSRPVQAAAAAFCAVRTLNVELLQCVLPEALHRRGLHLEYDVYDVSTWLDVYAAHAEVHTAQIRQRLGPARLLNLVLGQRPRADRGQSWMPTSCPDPARRRAI